MADKVQLDYALLDVDFFDKPKTVALMGRFGHISALYLIQVILTLSKATDAVMDVYAAYGLGSRYGISIELSKEIIAYCVKENMLSLQGETLTQQRVAEDQERLAEKRRKDAEYQKQRRQGKRRDDVENDQAPVPVTVTDTDINKKYGVAIGNGLVVDEISYESLLMNLKRHELTVDDLPDISLILAKYYKKKPHLISDIGSEVQQPWVFGEVLKLKAAKATLKKIESPSGKEESFSDRTRRELRERKAKEQMQ